MGVIDRYRTYLPVENTTPVITLDEGGTPLVRARALAERIGCGSMDIYLKCEGQNPTGSFKDRGMTMAISKACETRSRAVICASTGNTSASAAAYAARAGMRCIVLIPDGAIALGKLSQALIHGAEVFAVRGNFDQALELVKTLSDRLGLVLVNSLNPFRLEGQKTGAFEIVDALGNSPDYHFIPVGNAGNISAYWMGYTEYLAAKKCGARPRMMGFQAAGAAPIVHGHAIREPETIATAIRIGNPASWQKAVAARDESGGVIDMVTDEEILSAYKLLASCEGVFVEPASAASVAGLIKYWRSGKLSQQGARTVCVLTGHGLKDPDRAIKEAGAVRRVEATIEALTEALRT